MVNHIKNIIVKIQLIMIFFIPAVSFSAIPSSDELTCLLPNGDQFHLLKHFDFEPICMMAPCNKREGDHTFKVYYEPHGKKKLKEFIIKINYSNSIKNLKERQQLCAKISSYNNVVTVEYLVKLNSQANVFVNLIKFFNHSNKKYVYENIKQQKLFSISEAYYYRYHENLLFMEMPYTIADKYVNGHSVVHSVQQAASTDNGKTWSPFILTTESKIFTIGKSFIEHEGIAKPGRYKVGLGD